MDENPSGDAAGSGPPRPVPPTAPSYPQAPPSYPQAPPGGYPPPQAGYPGSAGGMEPSAQAPYAGWGLRLGGYLIDTVIFLLVLVVLLVAFKHTHALQFHLRLHQRRGGTRRRAFSGLAFLLTALLSLTYVTVLCGGKRGQTVGMMAVGVRLVRDGTMVGVGYGRALGRGVIEQVLRLLNLIAFLLGLVWILDMLWPLWDKKNQTLHDKAAGTVVVRARPPAG